VGILGFVAAFAVNYTRLLRYVWSIYGALLFVLVGLLFMKTTVKGTHAWITLPGGFSLQPSEFMKIVLIMALASHLPRNDNYRRLAGLAGPLVLTVVPMALVVVQPDLGTALIFPPLLFAMLFVAGARVKHLALIAFLGALALVPMWYMAPSYQRKRVEAFVHPERYRLHEAYQLVRSKVAIGSGGVAGKGLHKGLQHQLGLPEKHTDFIFAVICEEGGFLQGGLLLVLYFALCATGISTAEQIRDPAGRLIAVGVATLFASQVFVNVAVTLGMMPTTGVTLPMVSYGGSSMLCSMMALGLLFNVRANPPDVLAADRFS